MIRQACFPPVIKNAIPEGMAKRNIYLTILKTRIYKKR
jgi:hypothetical protein